MRQKLRHSLRMRTQPGDSEPIHLQCHNDTETFITDAAELWKPSVLVVRPNSFDLAC